MRGRIIKIFLNQGYTPINQNIFKPQTTIDFDCYIKRFNGFAIFIERGTFLDEKIYSMLSKNHLQIYIQNTHYEQFKAYNLRYNPSFQTTPSKEEVLTLEMAILHCEEIHKLLSTQSSTYEKLKTLYTQGKHLLDAWVVRKDEKKIPFTALIHLIDKLIEIINKERITLSHFNGFLDDTYSLSSHLVKVSFFTLIVARELQLDLNDQENIALAAILHDIGKCDIDENLLDKPDMLSVLEFKMIQAHVDASVTLVKQSGLKDRVILNAIKEHHERLDGSGYPRKLKESLLSQFGKIIAVCDVFDALITQKPYRAAYSTFNASSLLREEYKGKLDTRCIHSLIKNLR